MKIREISVDSLNHDEYFKKRYDETCGAVYIAKYKNGFIKIGSTSNPRDRYKQLLYFSVEYAGAQVERFAITNPLEEYKTLETILHRRFMEWNIRKELFNVDFEEAIQTVNKEFYEFDCPKSTGFKFTAKTFFVNIVRSGRMPTDEERKTLAIMAFSDGLEAYDFYTTK